jgi:hypothetical protein
MPTRTDEDDGEEAAAGGRFAALAAELEDMQDSDLPWAVSLRAAWTRVTERADAHEELSHADRALLGGLTLPQLPAERGCHRSLPTTPPAREERAQAWKPAQVTVPGLHAFCDPATKPDASPEPTLGWEMEHAASMRSFLDIWHGSIDVDRARLGSMAMQAGGGSLIARDATHEVLRMGAAEEMVAARRCFGLLEPRCTFDITCPGCSVALASAAEAVLHYPSCAGPVALTQFGAGNLYATHMTHEAVKQALGRCMTEAGCLVLEEVPGLFDQGQQRPGDVVFKSWCWATTTAPRTSLWTSAASACTRGHTCRPQLPRRASCWRRPRRPRGPSTRIRLRQRGG